MIDDLDRTLAALLRRELPPSLVEQVQISFAAPDQHFSSHSVTPPAINLFLYDVRENLELRSNEVFVQPRSNGTALVTRAPVRVDFSYLITAWGSDSAPDTPHDEHHLLGEILRVLLRHKALPGELLQGVLASQELPLPVSGLQPIRLQSLGEFWHVLGGKPRTALNYVVTAAVDVSAAQEVHLVTEKVLKIRPDLGGRE